TFPLHMLYVINPVLNDTLATIPIEANKFHYTFSVDLAEDYYTLIFDGYFGKQAYFGAFDSVFVSGRANENATELTFTGTRFAEHQLGPPAQIHSIADYYLQHNM